MEGAGCEHPARGKGPLGAPPGRCVRIPMNKIAQSEGMRSLNPGIEIT